MAPAPVYPQPQPAYPQPQPAYPAAQPQPMQPQPMQPQPMQPQPQPGVYGAMPAPAPATPAPAGPPGGAKASDHETWAVGRVGVGWFGTKNVPYDVTVTNAGTANATLSMATQATPAIGIRYWLNPSLGIDAGLGFYSEGGSSKVEPPGTSVDKPSHWTFLVHGGLPIAFLNAGHFSFQLTPEADIGIGGGSETVPQGTSTTAIDKSGLAIQIGARVGSEIHFGFMGIPQLSLDASVGAYFATATAKETVTPPAPGQVTTYSLSGTMIGTSQINSPWDIFRSNIAARYYF
jgi:hypothetical protein